MIESVTEKNLEEVLPLIRKYQEFYKIAKINDDVNREFFSQFGENSATGCQFIYRDEDGTVKGFATVYFSFASSIPAKIAIMNDLYTQEDQRGKGIGKQLINHCLAFSKKKGAARLQWITAEDNKVAQGLYDSLNTNNSTWKVYTYTG